MYAKTLVRACLPSLTCLITPQRTGNTCSCANEGTAATGDACTTDNANICTACTGEFYLGGSSCIAWASDCTAGQTETQTPSNTQDRVCAGANGVLPPSPCIYTANVIRASVECI